MGRLAGHCDTATPCVANPQLPTFCHRCAHPMRKPHPKGWKAKKGEEETASTADADEDNKK
ncbi:uncharacterized protein EHS24_002059 [Apiotrichum porosum]|uniref:Uncharacterized protein n=1 Tax=Apiotrichum porosum TaxID=105984 RepID=A0A427XHG7_9TREE|nr:uncharacterized protein EHS24_002059 [Apiotrichum porosum]RSH78339.1 hypothetical protein EHS24_002059 [Apiotrichum porosum]